EIGMIIKDKFDGASEVTIEEEDAQPRIIMKNSQFKRHTNADLKYNGMRKFDIFVRKALLPTLEETSVLTEAKIEHETPKHPAES
ncbi:hypothetical protein ANCDUO_26512, partial [Ancylostoma duodenale]